MYTRYRTWLRPKVTFFTPVCAECEGHLQSVGISKTKYGIYLLLESFRICKPQFLVQVDSHKIESQVLTDSEFLIQNREIECIILPHLKLIDRI